MLLLMAPVLASLCGCEDVQSIFNTHGPAASSIATLSWALTIAFLVTSLVMWILIAWAAARHRGTLQEHAPVNIGGGQGWIVMGGLLIPIVVLSGFFIAGLVLLSDFPINKPENTQPLKPDLLIVGHQWWWELRYLDGPMDQHFTAADEIHIPVNKPFNIELKSDDVIHAFWIPSLHGKLDMIPGHPNFMRIEASQPGIYTGQCAVYCGEQHAHMRLMLIAQTPEEYQAWVQQQLKPAHEPTTPEAIAGEQVFLNGPCMMCHAVRGTIAGGHVAPDLTHLAGRQFIGADSFPNNKAYLAAWVTHAQSLKPGCLMPNLTMFTGGQLRQLVAYLQQLK
ncbi:MAG TPA: cytochrome c oxidase subunit II [Acidobacteriaceae bacterium]|jgi:cytochrome c oxidase subunit 2|nr:cytochrome c oxidase subunit II [Acidobacteriaceae bacterium]